MAGFRIPGRSRAIIRQHSSKDRTWRKKLIEQRSNKCEICGYPGYVELHHKDRVIDGGIWDYDNLILLCEKCHADAHGKRKKNYLDARREYWEP